MEHVTPQKLELASSPATNDDVPLAVRYTLPVDALALAALLLLTSWLLTL